jgi:hypothetical protein
MPDQLASLIERQQDLVKDAETRLTENRDDIDEAMRVRQMFEFSHRAAGVAEARRVLFELQAQRDRRDAAIVDHAAAEENNAAALATLGKDLVAARGKLAKSTEAAIQAITALWDAAAEYDGYVAGQGAALREADLPALHEEGDMREVFATGGYDPHRSQHPHLILNGQQWHKVNPDAVIKYAHQSARAARTYTLMPTPDRRTTGVYPTLDPVVRRPEPVPHPASPLPTPEPRDMNAPVMDSSGRKHYQDGTVVEPLPRKYVGGRWVLDESGAR